VQAATGGGEGGGRRKVKGITKGRAKSIKIGMHSPVTRLRLKEEDRLQHRNLYKYSVLVSTSCYPVHGTFTESKSE
jgi:hypothetical protein